MKGGGGLGQNLLRWNGGFNFENLMRRVENDTYALSII